MDRPPHTVQRICELLASPPGTPGACYGSPRKYWFALERAFCVTSTTSDPLLLGTSKAMQID